MSLDTIKALAQTIYAQAEKARYNKAQCKLLAVRVSRLATVIPAAKSVKDKRVYEQTLAQLEGLLEEIDTFINKFHKKGWRDKAKLFVRAGAYERAFERYANQLDVLKGNLQITTQLQSLKNREEDLKAQKKDMKRLKTKLCTMGEENQQAHDEVKGLLGNIDEQLKQVTTALQALRQRGSSRHAIIAALADSAKSQGKTRLSDIHMSDSQASRFDKLTIAAAAGAGTTVETGGSAITSGVHIGEPQKKPPVTLGDNPAALFRPAQKTDSQTHVLEARLHALQVSGDVDADDRKDDNVEQHIEQLLSQLPEPPVSRGTHQLGK